MEGRKVVGIMACDPSGVIGSDGGIPWRCEAELQHFLNIISNGILVMGRKTFESLPKSLKDKHRCVVFSKTTKTHHCGEAKTMRQSILSNNVRSEIGTTGLLSSASNDDSAITFISSLKEFEQLDISRQSRLFMIGGAKIAHLFLQNNLISEFILTIMHKKYSGDTKLDLSLLKDWMKETISTSDNYNIYRYSPKVQAHLQ